MKNILLSLIVIVAVASLGAVGTYTSFVDTEVSEGNSWQAGSLELQLGDSVPYPNASAPYTVPDEDYGADPLGDSVQATWDHTLGYPNGMDLGDTLAGRVKLRNWGTIEATSLDIACVNENYPPTGETEPDDKDTVMIITYLQYHNSGFSQNLLLLLEASPGSPVTLHDWEQNPITGLTPPPLNSEAFLDMTVQFDPNASTDYEECSTNMTLIFTLQ